MARSFLPTGLNYESAGLGLPTQPPPGTFNYRQLQGWARGRGLNPDVVSLWIDSGVLAPAGEYQPDQHGIPAAYYQPPADPAGLDAAARAVVQQRRAAEGVGGMPLPKLRP